MSYTRNKYTVIRHSIESVVLTDKVLVVEGEDHEAKVSGVIDSTFALYPDAVIETTTSYMLEQAYVDTTLPVVEEPVVEPVVE